jgi:hypothetical protein
MFAQETTDTMNTKRTKVKIKTKGKPNDMTTTTTSTGMNTNTMVTTANPTSATIVLMTGWRTDPASLPVVGTGVSAEVVTTLKTKYGDNIYDIKKIRTTSGQDAYAVRVMENGQYTIYYVGADGNVVTK